MSTVFPMDFSSTRLGSPGTAKLKAAKALKKVPIALLLKRKAECDAKALRIVERMTEPGVEVDWLVQSLFRINKSHMEDIAEERSIIKLCGYVLCDNPLTKVVTKRYQISTLRNKVYDVSKVKNYCSYGCYRAAEYLTEQMPTSPLWARDRDETPNFRILPKKSKDARSKSPPGVEVDLTGVRLPEDTDNSEGIPDSRNFEKDSWEKRGNCVPNNEQKLERLEGSKTTCEVTSEKLFEFAVESAGAAKREEEAISTGAPDSNLETFQESSSVGVDETFSRKGGEGYSTKALDESFVPASRATVESSHSLGETARPSVSMSLRKSTESRKNERRKVKESRKSTRSFDALTARIEKSFKEWITDKTVCLLHGEVAEKQKILESVNRDEKYAVLRKKLNHLQLEEERGAREGIDELKPAPDFSTLQEEAKGLELKVRAFWEGKTVINRELGKVENSGKQNDDQSETILPLIDLHAPNALRRRIFLDKLNKVLVDLLRALAGTDSYTSERCATVKALVSTFSLSATNIIFKTAEWTMVALIIIKLLGVIDPRMKYLLGSKRATMYISMILMSYKLESNYPECLIASLVNPPVVNEIEETEPFDS